MDKKTILIMPLIAGREAAFRRTCDALKRLNFTNSILVLRDDGAESFIVDGLDMEWSSQCYALTGMCAIFQAISAERETILAYDFACYCDDDNLVSPSFLEVGNRFLKNNEDFVGCNGLRFLMNDYAGKPTFLARYQSQELISDSKFGRLQEYAQQGGILFYTLLRSSVLIAVVSASNVLKDDNLSEISVNFSLPSFGKIKLLPDIQLARFYPRPAVFNIVSPLNWIKRPDLQAELVRCHQILLDSYGVITNSPDESQLFEQSLGKYLALRFTKVPANLFKSINKKITDGLFHAKNAPAVKTMLGAVGEP